MKITAIVVLYNSSLEQSATINSISDCLLDNIQLNLVIWNNGPDYLKSNDINVLNNKVQGKNITFSIYQQTTNVALSKIYNYFINRESYDFIAILDHDSALNQDFFLNIINSSSYDIIVPKIIASGWRSIEETVCFPTYINSVKVLDKDAFSVGEIFTISSGITLSSKLIKCIEKTQSYVFNEKFALYGIDTCFFQDVHKMNLQSFNGKCIGSIKHSLATSQLDNGNINISSSRKLELGYDTILQRIYCKRKSTLSSSFFLIKNFIKRKNSLAHTIKLFICLFTKQHPRSKILMDLVVK